MSMNRTTGTSIAIGITGLLIGRVLRPRPRQWYEPEAAEPIRHVAQDDEAVLTRLLLGGGISRDRYRTRLERLAATEGWSLPSL
jgi:hypothetical protein